MILNDTSIETYSEIVKAAFIYLVVFFALQIFSKIILNKMVKKADGGHRIYQFLADLIKSIGYPFYVFVPLFIVTKLTYIRGMPYTVDKIIASVTFVVVSYYAIRFAREILCFVSVQNTKIQASSNITNLIKISTSVVLWLIVGIVILDSFGLNVSNVIGSLGVLGIAAAIAIQNILGDIFAFITIYVDRPFKVDDVIQIDSFIGKVKKIGVRSTRLEGLLNQEIIVSNRELTGAKLVNFGKLDKKANLLTLTLIINEKINITDISPLISAVFSKILEVKVERISIGNLANNTVSFTILYKIDTSCDDEYFKARDKVITLLYKELKQKVEIQSLT